MNGISSADVKKLADAGIHTLETLAHSSKNDLSPVCLARRLAVSLSVSPSSGLLSVSPSDSLSTDPLPSRVRAPSFSLPLRR